MTVSCERTSSDCVLVVRGDLSTAATLVQLRAALSTLAFTERVPVVVDLSAATGTSACVRRLLVRAARMMARRGLPFTVRETVPPLAV